MMKKIVQAVLTVTLLLFAALNAYLALKDVLQTQKIVAQTTQTSTLQADISTVLKDLTDMETGYKVFRREVVESFSLRENDFRIEPEMTAQVLKNARLRVYELPISYYGRTYDEGKKITWRDGAKAIRTLTRCRLGW